MLTLAHAPSARRSTFDGLAAVTLRAGALEAVFVPCAGMAGVSLRHDGAELLDRREGVRAYARSGATMGIPFLHPWANRLEGWPYETDALPRDEHGIPIHGVLPQAWEVVACTADDERATVDAALGFSSPAFPFPHRVMQHIGLDAGALTVTTTLRPAGHAPVPIAFGFHPYLTLPGVARAAWVIDLPARRHLVADARSLPTGETAWMRAERAPLGSRAFDDGYDALGHMPRFAVSGGGREVAVTFLRGYPVAQVFAPAGQDVVCFEPMTAPVNALSTGRGLRRIAPGATFTAVFEIRVTG
jgi:aldose 1-epimerase